MSDIDLQSNGRATELSYAAPSPESDIMRWLRPVACMALLMSIGTLLQFRLHAVELGTAMLSGNFSLLMEDRAAVAELLSAGLTAVGAIATLCRQRWGVKTLYYGSLMACCLQVLQPAVWMVLEYRGLPSSVWTMTNVWQVLQTLLYSYLPAYGLSVLITLLTRRSRNGWI